VQKNQYSVRKVEEMVQMLKQGEDVQAAKKKLGAKTQMPPEMAQARQKLADLLKAKVQLTCAQGGKGKITIPFADTEELARIMAAIGLNDK
jgi:ParB family chromosome partitioning protein